MDNDSDNYCARFPYKLWKLINERNNNLLSWSNSGRSILVNYILLDDYLKSACSIFKTRNTTSFVRQLNLYGFQKVPTQLRDIICNRKHPEMHEFRHELFNMGRPELIWRISRKDGGVRKQKSYRPASTHLQVARKALQDALDRARDEYVRNGGFTISDHFRSFKEEVVDELTNDEQEIIEIDRSENAYINTFVRGMRPYSYISETATCTNDRPITSNATAHDNFKAEESHNKLTSNVLHPEIKIEYPEESSPEGSFTSSDAVNGCLPSGMPTEVAQWLQKEFPQLNIAETYNNYIEGNLALSINTDISLSLSLPISFPIRPAGQQGASQEPVTTNWVPWNYNEQWNTTNSPVQQPHPPGIHREQALQEQAPQEQQATREQLLPEQVPQEQAPQEQATREQLLPEQVPQEQAPREQAPQEQATREQLLREQVPQEQAPHDVATREQAHREEPEPDLSKPNEVDDELSQLYAELYDTLKDI